MSGIRRVSASMATFELWMITYGERDKFKRTIAGMSGSEGATPLLACSGVVSPEERRTATTTALQLPPPSHSPAPPPPSAPNKENKKRKTHHPPLFLEHLVKKDRRGASRSTEGRKHPREAALHGKAQSRMEEGAGRVDKACRLHRKPGARSGTQDAKTSGTGAAPAQRACAQIRRSAPHVIADQQRRSPVTRGGYPPHATNGKMHRPATLPSTPPPPSTSTTRSTTGAAIAPIPRTPTSPLHDGDTRYPSASRLVRAGLISRHRRLHTRSVSRDWPISHHRARRRAYATLQARDWTALHGRARVYCPPPMPPPASAPMQPPPTADARPVSSLRDMETVTGREVARTGTNAVK
ncbi:hypothetical protein C8R44DRAFT_854717 [Mycena epipterygia]|nr:hypothetical protein C8R44DRAFT_854717 [Mycena epipterygia]